MALKHAALLEVIDLVSPGLVEQAGNINLIRTPHLQLVRLNMAAGQRMPVHHVPGEITLHCLSGKVDIEVPSRVCSLRSGQVVVLGADEPHGLLAHEASVVLLTLLHPPA